MPYWFRAATSSTPVVVPVDDRPTPKTAPSKGVMALGKKGGKDVCPVLSDDELPP